MNDLEIAQAVSDAVFHLNKIRDELEGRRIKKIQEEKIINAIKKEEKRMLKHPEKLQ